MIDVEEENLLTIKEAAEHVSKLTGKPLRRSTIYGWATRGRMGVRLETVYLGAVYTSVEAIQRFSEASAAAAVAKHEEGRFHPEPSAARHEAAMAELEAKGVF
jgi:hypothetical protein